MTATPTGEELLAALTAQVGDAVAGASAGAPDDLPDHEGLPPHRAEALVTAWTGARLHAGLAGLLVGDATDVRLLAGDWCFARALGAVTAAADAPGLRALCRAIEGSAAGPDGPVEPRMLTRIWRRCAEELAQPA